LSKKDDLIKRDMKGTDGDTKAGCAFLVVILIIVIAVGIGVHKHNVTKKAEAVKQEQIAKQKQQAQAEKEAQEKKEEASQANSTNVQKTNVKLDKLFKLSEIKGKAPSEVNNIIGQPDAQRNDKWEYYDTHEETDAVVEIFHKKQFDIELWFIDGVAARLSLEPKVKIQTNQIADILKMFSLGFTEPTYANDYGMRWVDQFGIYEFSISYQDYTITLIDIILDEKYR
jgi:uncharacterized protein YxeA